MYYVYVLENSRGCRYIGYTDNVQRRLSEHQKRDDQTYKIVYYEAYVAEKQARDRERKLKHYGSAWRALRQRISA